MTVSRLTTNAKTILAFNLVTAGTADGGDQIDVTNGLTLNGGTIQVANTSSGAGSLGYYRILEYSGAIGGAGVGSLVLPAVQDNIAYTLDTMHDPGFIDLHRGLLGDANDDGVVNAADFATLSSNFGKSGAGWAGGDFNNDGVVDFADFAALSNNFGGTIGASDIALGEGAPSGVPEPATLAPLGVAATMMLRRRGSRV